MSVGIQDAWSDIDLVLGLADPAELGDVMADWADLLYGEYAAVHHVDLASGATIYRAFLLPSACRST